MKRILTVVVIFLLLVIVSYASFIIGQKYLLHTSIEHGKAILRDYRAMNESLENLNDLRYRSIIVFKENSNGMIGENLPPNKVVAAVRAVQSRGVYVVLYSDGAIEEYIGSLDNPFESRP